MHGMTDGIGGVRARSELGTKLSGAGDEGRDRARQQGSDQSKSSGSGSHDNGKDAGQGIQSGQHEGKRWEARIDR